jgi:FtsP/CotA-like multicopper oxidase with cupredoxin domain
MIASLFRVPLCTFLVLSAGSALAGDVVERPLLDVPSLREAAAEGFGGNNPFRASSAEGQWAGREIRYVLAVRMTKGSIYNRATGKHDQVLLRTYNDSLLAPRIDMRPGQTVRLLLKNELKGSDCVPNKDMNKPKCFDSTNLHSHGLWISPSGNSDNVLLNIKPGVRFEYEYNVPEDHPAGTFWYHPHMHGSTAVQVGSGMAGPLIIRGDRVPTPTRTGDIDTLLKPFDPKFIRGKPDYADVLLFQQIPYACFNKDGSIKVATDPKDSKTTRWSCDDGEVGEIKDFAKQFGAGTWAASGRYTMINGQVQPSMTLEAGRLYRWRLIQSGVRESIRLRISKVVPNAKQASDTMSKSEEHAYIKEACSQKPEDQVAQWEIATDGLTRKQIVSKFSNDLQPGYRSDVLLVFPSEGDYCVYDEATDATQTVSASPENSHMLARVFVRGGRRVPTESVQRFLTDRLVEAARALPPNVRTKVQDELRQGLMLSSFVPHPDIKPEEVAGRTQNLFFNITGAGTSAAAYLVGDEQAQVKKGDNPDEIQKYQTVGLPYDGARTDRTLVLDTAEEWVLNSKFASHPFHIHVNPFQIASITWKDDKKDDKGNVIEQRKGKPVGEDDPNYAGMVGTWKDTIFVRTDVEVRVRTRYERYIGDFVLHCHILDHEDQGMMQNVRITYPDEKGGAMSVGHMNH